MTLMPTITMFFLVYVSFFCLDSIPANSRTIVFYFVTP